MPNVSDDFNRTESPLGTSSSGHVWSHLSGATGAGFDGGSGRTVAYQASGTGNACVLDCGATDHTAAAIVVRRNGQWGLIIRAVDNNNYYLFNVQSDGTSQLYKKASGSFTLLSNGGTVSVTDAATFQAAGSALTAKLNGSTTATATDSALATGTKGGLRGGGDDFYDDFALTDDSGGGGGTPSTSGNLLLLGVG